MDVSAVIATVGGIALMVGILGGGIEAERIKVPIIPKLPRLISGLVGAILIITSVWLSSFPRQPLNVGTQNLSTSTPSAIETSLAVFPTNSSPMTVSTVNPNRVVFALDQAVENSFYKLGNANFILDSDKSLVVYGAFSEGVYLREKMPDNFRVKVRFKTGDSDSQVIIGISDGFNWRPNYHFVMFPGWSAFKKQIVADENWDYYLESINKGGTETNSTFEVEFERSDGYIKIFVNGEPIILFGEEQDEINGYNYLYFTGDNQRHPYIIEKLTLEDLGS